MTWLLPAELTNLRTRIHANAVSTIFNWLSNVRHDHRLLFLETLLTFL
jgi:hypothetical protein